MTTPPAALIAVSLSPRNSDAKTTPTIGVR
jgi:hypothetical protein